MTALQLPDNLGARCSLLFQWDEDYTVRALEGYLQFMELKANFEDWDSDQLAPSTVIDLVWQQHLLYNKQYNEACTTYCGQLIGYDPDSALMQEGKEQGMLVKTTKIALKALFGRRFDGNIWSFQAHGSIDPNLSLKGIASKVTFDGSVEVRKNDETREEEHGEPPVRHNDTISDSEAEGPSSHRQQQQQQEQQHRQNATREQHLPKNKSDGSSPAPPTTGESVTVKIKCFIDGKTQDTCIRVKRTTKMKKVEDCLARLMHLDGADSVRFLVDGEQVSPWETLESMKVIDPEQHWFTVMPKVAAYQ